MNQTIPSSPMSPGLAGVRPAAVRPAEVPPAEVYQQFLHDLNKAFNKRIDIPNLRLFKTDVPDLWETYLNSLPEATRQYHTCTACRHFIQRYGSLVTIDSQGRQRSALWADSVFAPAYYFPALQKMQELVEHAKVIGVFIPEERVLGTPQTGDWRHLAITVPLNLVHVSRALTANQTAAERLEDFKTMQRAIGEFNRAVVAQAVVILEADALYRSEKVLGPAKWLLELHDVLANAPDTQWSYDNLIWRAVASAPPGFAHPRSSMIGTLLEDLAEGLPLADVSRKFKAKMDPLQYQRPQAAPSAGNLASAEKLVEKLGIAPSLVRRFARPEDVQTIWTPPRSKTPATPTEGVFAGIAPKVKAPAPTDAKVLDLPSQNMTWTRFAETALPKALAVEVYLTNNPQPITAFTTAVHPDAPPILQWDREDVRNPVAWYVWNNGSVPRDWSLTANRFHKVWGISNSPSHWFGSNPPNQKEAAVLLIEGLRETKQSGSALFPEILKSELHSVRSSIEAYSRKHHLEGLAGPHAGGLVIGHDSKAQVRVRVTTAASRAEYVIDRWI